MGGTWQLRGGDGRAVKSSGGGAWGLMCDAFGVTPRQNGGGRGGGEKRAISQPPFVGLSGEARHQGGREMTAGGGFL
jgi:hypothetical protein